MNFEWKHMIFIIMTGAVLGYWACTSKKQASDKATDISSHEMPETNAIQKLHLLAPPRGSKRLLSDEADFTKALSEAKKGDMEYMIGLIDWYSRHGEGGIADHWHKRLDEERRAHGLPSLMDSIPPLMRGDKPVPKKKPE